MCTDARLTVLSEQGIVRGAKAFFEDINRPRGGDVLEDDLDENDELEEGVDNAWLTLNGLQPAVAMDEDLGYESEEGDSSQDGELQQASRDKPLFHAGAPASKYRVEQAIHGIGTVLHSGQVHSGTAEKLTRMIHALLPEGNNFPRCASIRGWPCTCLDGRSVPVESLVAHVLLVALVRHVSTSVALQAVCGWPQPR
jgi:hypothetical protein